MLNLAKHSFQNDLFVSSLHLITFRLYESKYQWKLLWWLSVSSQPTTPASLYIVHSRHIDLLAVSWTWYQACLLIRAFCTCYPFAEMFFPFELAGLYSNITCTEKTTILAILTEAPHFKSIPSPYFYFASWHSFLSDIILYMICFLAVTPISVLEVKLRKGRHSCLLFNPQFLEECSIYVCLIIRKWIFIIILILKPGKIFLLKLHYWGAWIRRQLEK